MQTRIHARLMGVLLACLVAAGCVKERYHPASALPARWTAQNACGNLEQVQKVRPRYPLDAAAHRHQGWVALKYHVAANGDVFNVRVVASSPRGVFDDASAAALVNWRYEPMTYPVPNCTHVYVFTLNDGPPPAPATQAGSFAAFEAIPAR